MTPQRLILFAKRPRSGKVKTRLVPPLSAEQALALYRVFLQDCARLVGDLDREDRQVELCLDGPCESADLPTEAARLHRTVQGEGDLGERLHGAFLRSATDGCSATVVIGADAPNLPRRRILDAFAHLSEVDAVMGPASDGGYFLIGLRRPRRELFRDMPWGHPGVAAATRRRARGLGLTLVELAPWYDVDDREGLRRLRADLQLARPAVAPATTAHLRSLDGVYSAML